MTGLSVSIAASTLTPTIINSTALSFQLPAGEGSVNIFVTIGAQVRPSAWEAWFACCCLCSFSPLGSLCLLLPGLRASCH